jgi:hypothetical protein
MPSVYNQLSLLSDFDKYERRDERLVNELLKAISNLKYFRINVRFTEFNRKDDLESILSQILYWMAWVAWKKAKYLPEYKADYNLDRFLVLTKEAPGLNVTIPLDIETMSEYFRKANIRTKTMFIAYRDILQTEKEPVKRILDYFNKLHDLTYE